MCHLKHIDCLNEWMTWLWPYQIHIFSGIIMIHIILYSQKKTLKKKYVLNRLFLQKYCNLKYSGPVSLGCRIHWLHLCRRVGPPPNRYPGYDTKQSDGEVPVLLELWGMWSTPSLVSLWPGVVALDRVLSMGQIELNCVLMLNWIA